MKRAHHITKSHSKHPFSYHAIVLILALSWLMVIGLSLFIVNQLRKETNTTTSNGVTLTVSSLYYDTSGAEPFTVPPGWKFAIVDVTIENKSSKEFDFAPVLQTFMSDSAGNEYQMSPASLSNPIRAGKIKHGESAQGSLSYLVPVSVENPTLHFITD